MADLVEVRVNGKTIRDAVAENRTADLQLVSNALVVTTRLAKTIRKRAQRGLFATSRLPYNATVRGSKSRPRWYFISEGYQQKVGAPQRRYLHSNDFHSKSGKMIAGNITGGMWKGLRVRNFGVRGAIIEFTGRSLGSRIKKRSRGKPNQRVKVGNRRKAATVFKTLKVNVIAPRDQEIEALGTAAVEVLGTLTAFGAPVTVQPSGDRTLARALVEDIRTGRVTRYL